MTALEHKAEETEGAWLGFNKGTLEQLPVINIDKLTPAELKTMSDYFDEISRDEFNAFPAIETDSIRKEIDALIAKVFRLKDFSILRGFLAQEPWFA
jgi:glutamate mutase epsilon subunit